MSHRDLLNSTSRAAVILGMTNTDQIGMWQAMAPQTVARQPAPEVLPDSGADGSVEGGDRGEVDENTGLTADELAEFESMRTGEPPATGDADPDPDADPDGDPDVDATDPADPAPAAADRAPKTPAELAAEAAAGKRPAGTPKTISLGKHQRELKAAQERATAAEERERKALLDFTKVNERVAIINEALQARAAAPAAEEPAAPVNPFEEADIKPEEDYAAALDQERRRNRYAYEASQQTQQRVVETSEDAQMRDTFTRDFQRVAAHPEYSYLPQAYQFLKDARLTQIFLSEFDKDPNDPNEQFTPQEIQRAVQLFNGEEKWLVGNAIKARKSPAHAILKQARVYGYKPQAAAPEPAPAPAALAPAVPARRAVAPAAAAPAAPSAAEALEALRTAQQDARSLSDGGGAPPQGLSAEMLLALDDEQFAEMVDSMSPGQLNALMGRGPG